MQAINGGYRVSVHLFARFMSRLVAAFHPTPLPPTEQKKIWNLRINARAPRPVAPPKALEI
jgi:hypothetical protein